MQHLISVPVRRLRIAAARLRTQRRRDGLQRAIWVAARNYRHDALAAPDDALEAVQLPHTIAETIHTLTPDYTDDKPATSLDG